ncbi:hypothetical protein TRFO_26305 [Tritrichomonas foetus]|uniref:DUF3447 domain-containing protein n=1 Tax=Tritrichomonas foetus TaxID=1144522 RepID=A0A1J4K351_9EUKA|nr:hypothetical protein TRFO_26305 [Tritrichomonas foetus]|eukprot:OHT05865.1 hypothetical protein TRFO_26305 [Tritrichomonas foetus]
MSDDLITIKFNDSLVNVARSDASRIGKVFQDKTKNNFEIQIPDIPEDLNLVVLFTPKINVNEENLIDYKIIAEKLENPKLVKIIEDAENFIGQFGKSPELKELKKLEKMLLQLSEETFHQSLDLSETFLKNMSQELFLQALYRISLFLKKNNNRAITNLLKSLDQKNPGILKKFINLIIRNYSTSIRKADFTNSCCHSPNCEIYSFLHHLFEEKLITSSDFSPLIKFHPILYDHVHVSKIIRKNLAENDINLHKQYCELGYILNTELIALRNDDVDAFQSIVNNNPKFDINKKHEGGIYERISLLNSKEFTYIQYSAYFSAIKCFKYIINNFQYIDKSDIMVYAIAGGNPEIVHLCKDFGCETTGTLIKSINYHSHELVNWIIENQYDKIPPNSINECIESSNFISLKNILQYNCGFDIEIDYKNETFGFIPQNMIGLNNILTSAIENQNELLVKLIINVKKYDKKNNISVLKIILIQFFPSY